MLPGVCAAHWSPRPTGKVLSDKDAALLVTGLEMCRSSSCLLRWPPALCWCKLVQPVGAAGHRDPFPWCGADASCSAHLEL